MANDYGVKVSRPGADVLSSADTLLVYSSSWPVLKIHKTGLVDVPGQGEVSVPHSLGYYPVAIVFAHLSSGNTSRIAMYSLSCSTSNIIIENYRHSTVTYRYIIFRQNLEEPFRAPILRGTSSIGDFGTDYGIKATVPDASVNSSDPRLFSMHSGYTSPLIHMVDNGVASAGGPFGYQKIVSHGLGYIPTALSFYKKSGGDKYIFTSYSSAGVGETRYEITDTQLLQYGDDYFLSGPPQFGCIIFKNPLQQATINARYP
jgi:hypothetical protein